LRVLSSVIREDILVVSFSSMVLNRSVRATSSDTSGAGGGGGTGAANVFVEREREGAAVASFEAPDRFAEEGEGLAFAMNILSSVMRGPQSL
jgi:hypothetical protein